MHVQQVFPEFRDSTVAEAYSGIARTRRNGRPWIVMSMISSADGAVSIGGTSGGLGGSKDREVLRHLRSLANGVLVGAGTVRSESYSPLPSHQTLAVVSRSNDLGTRTEDLISAGNTIVVSGNPLEICSSLEGDIWILEGGPSLNAQMIAADCVDEICLTISPKFIAGDMGRIVSGTAEFDLTETAHEWKLESIGRDGNFVFLRYVRD